MKPEADFDELSRRAYGPAGGRADLDRLFTAVFALSEWLFIARGEFPNVYPYAASAEAFADGQTMIRAFTDDRRIQLFVTENSLASSSDETLTLTIPTDGVVEYLEPFAEQGVYGVWFNSDAASDGFYSPLKQLRPIKDYLARLL